MGVFMAVEVGEVESSSLNALELGVCLGFDFVRAQISR